MLELKSVSKTLSGERIFENVSLRVGNGELAVILCEDDEQRIILSSLIAGAISQSDGAILVNGYNLSKHKYKAAKQIGFIPAEGALYENMSVREFLFFVAEAKEIPYERINTKVQEVLELCDLESRADRLSQSLSYSDRRKVLLAQALLGDVSVLVICEAADELDVSARKVFSRVIREMLDRTASVVALCREDLFDADLEKTVYRLDGISLSDNTTQNTEDERE